MDNWWEKSGRAERRRRWEKKVMGFGSENKHGKQARLMDRAWHPGGLAAHQVIALTTNQCVHACAAACKCMGPRTACS